MTLSHTGIVDLHRGSIIYAIRDPITPESEQSGVGPKVNTKDFLPFDDNGSSGKPWQHLPDQEPTVLVTNAIPKLPIDATETVRRVWGSSSRQLSPCGILLDAGLEDPAIL
ncbi:hypothetical protein EDD18DRAFT_1110309 [Armillaria luteobubalina]|uniref:Uncharacterized protein n=1 Tax=Armillaria luteobubalina TaxID=153913 RepID=A0AA39TGZ4_9AGAR|nr:hypothetical protein EDD18DRAFT_1110309 [Armillaria luteobubalina]